MPMNRSLYPEDWDAIALAIKVEANWICQDCGKKCIKPEANTSKLSRSERGKSTLTVHHLDFRPENNSKENLIALCAPCHLRIHRKAACEKNDIQKPRQGGDGGKHENTVRHLYPL